MTPQILTTAQELDSAPVGTVVLDSDGVAHQKISRTELHNGTVKSRWRSAAEGDTQDSGIMEELGEYLVIYTPEQASEPRKPSQREYVTEADVKELNNAPIGTFVADKEVDSWVKAHNGWAFVAELRAPLRVDHAPYTIIHDPRREPANL